MDMWKAFGNSANLLKESFGQLWECRREGWARRFFENWRDALEGQDLKPFEKFAAMIDRHWEGIAAYCRPENKVPLGFVEGLNDKIRVIQRRAYGLGDEEDLRFKILTGMLPAILKCHQFTHSLWRRAKKEITACVTSSKEIAFSERAEFPLPTLNFPPSPWWNWSRGRTAMSIAAKTGPEDPVGARNLATPAKGRQTSAPRDHE
jgi:hypothetical protein